MPEWMQIDVARACALADAHGFYAFPECGLFPDDEGWLELRQIEMLVHEVGHVLSLGYTYEEMPSKPRDLEKWVGSQLEAMPFELATWEEARVLAAELRLFPRLGISISELGFEEGAHTQGVAASVFEQARGSPATDALFQKIWSWANQYILVPRAQPTLFGIEHVVWRYDSPIDYGSARVPTP